MHPTWDGLNAVFVEVVEVLPRSVCDRHFVWKQNLCNDPVKMRSLEWFLIQYECVIEKGGHSKPETGTRRGCEPESTGKSGRPASQRMPKLASEPPEAGNEQNFPLDSPR